MVETIEKKEFLLWIKQNINFHRREVYWLLNYMINHEVLLEQTSFVESVEATPRGIKLDHNNSKQPICLYIDQHTFTDPEQIFHELRMNWKKELYVEIVVENGWANELYLSILEDNPYHSWNDQLNKDFEEELETYLESDKLQQELQGIYKKIDQALESSNEREFKRLSKLLSKMDQQ